jgi:hypothetical protein
MEKEQPTRRQLLALAGAAGLVALGLTRRLGAAAPSDYERTVLAKKPVAYWRLGEATGPDASDRTGNRHRGAYRGTPAFRQRGAIRGNSGAPETKESSTRRSRGSRSRSRTVGRPAGAAGR